MGHLLDSEFLVGRDLSLIHPTKTCRAPTSARPVLSVGTGPRARRTTTPRHRADVHVCAGEEAGGLKGRNT